MKRSLLALLAIATGGAGLWLAAPHLAGLRDSLNPPTTPPVAESPEATTRPGQPAPDPTAADPTAPADAAPGEVAPGEVAEAVLAAMRAEASGAGAEAVEIGRVVADHPGMVTMRTLVGSQRIVDMLVGEQLPRIC